MNAFFKYVFTVTAAIITFSSFSFALGFPWDTSSKNEIPWIDNLRQAQKLSRDSGKPILLHFFSDYCPPCRQMEAYTFPNPAIVEMVQNSFIPVKLNTQRFPDEAKLFKVQSIPMDIVLLPDGKIVHSALGGQDANRYGQFLAAATTMAKPLMRKFTADSEQVGTASISGRASVAGNNLGNREQEIDNGASSPANSTTTPSETHPSPSTPSLPEFPVLPNQEALAPGNPPALGTPPSIEAGGACPINETPSFDYASIPEVDRVRIEFEGYCPVELGKHSMWVRGDYNNRMNFEGRLYLFSGKEQMDEFKRNPEKYAPAYQGIDIVVWRERGQKVHGVRNYGAWAMGRVFLFSSEESLVKFEKNARYYITPNK